MGKELVTKAELARRAGVTGAAITKACNKSLKNAVEGGRIDVSHPSAIAYIAAHTGNTTPGQPHIRGYAARNSTRKQNSRPQEDGAFEVPMNIVEFADWTLRDIITHFGTDIAFVDFLKALKEIETINERRIKNAKAQGELVSRDLMKTGVIDPIDTALTKLLTDGARTISRRATAMHDANRDLQDIEAFIKDQISSFIRPMKAKIKRTFENVEN
jgi:hypothetical protein